MLVRQIALVSFALASTTSAFVVSNNVNAFTRSHVTSSVLKDPSMQGELLSEVRAVLVQRQWTRPFFARVY